jgi:hypothetical protein
MVALGRFPFAVGTASWYSVIAELPGGAIVRTVATALAGTTSDTTSARTALLIAKSLPPGR